MEKKKFLKIKHPISLITFFFKLNEFVNPELDLNDNLRSLTFFTAYIISELKTKLRCKIDEWIISGGGVKNDILMSDLRELISKKEFFHLKSLVLVVTLLSLKLSHLYLLEQLEDLTRHFQKQQVVEKVINVGLYSIQKIK